MAFGLTLGLSDATAKRVKESPATDCLIGLTDESAALTGPTVSCTDCDPACDQDASNAAPNGQCTFTVRAVLNKPTASCTAGTLKKASVKVAPKKAGKIVILASGNSSVEGAFTDLIVKTSKKGKKPGKAVVLATALVDKKTKDTDKIQFVCNPRPAGEACPTTSTTTTTTTSTTTTTLLSATCADACNVSTPCSGADVCMPPGSVSECTCKTCTPLSPTKLLTFRTGTGVATNCGGVGLSEGVTGPKSGTVLTNNPSDTPHSFDLGTGCLYIGGGNASVPGGTVPDGSAIEIDALYDCGGEILLNGRPRSDSPDNSRNCTQGVTPGEKACMNDLTNWPNLTSCTTDSDCPRGSVGGPAVTGSCVEKPNCLFGTPLPISNSGTSTCVVNTIGGAVGGSVVGTTGVSKLAMPLRSHTYLTGNAESPCPKCVSGTCNAGLRVGLSCSAPGVAGTTIECPPSGQTPNLYLPEFQVDLTPLTTGTATKTDAGGSFCPSQTNVGAFGVFSVFSTTAGTITENGSPAGDITDGNAHDVTLGSVFCIPATGNGLIDGAADLPGPGAVSLTGTFQLQ